MTKELLLVAFMQDEADLVIQLLDAYANSKELTPHEAKMYRSIAYGFRNPGKGKGSRVLAAAEVRRDMNE